MTRSWEERKSNERLGHVALLLQKLQRMCTVAAERMETESDPLIVFLLGSSIQRNGRLR